MMPVRKCQTARKFKQTPDGGWEPTFPSDPSGRDMTLMDMDPKLLRAPNLTLDDYMNALARIKPSVNEAEVKKHIVWAEAYGQDG